MSAGKVDVLAVMARAHDLVREIPGEWDALADIDAARAAVAELIEAANNAIVLCTEATSRWPVGSALREDAILRKDSLAAALARVQP